MIHGTDESDENIDIDRRLCVLTSKQMEVVRLRIKDYTMQEIADELGISKQVVNEHLEAAKKKLRKSQQNTLTK